jgi:hypothetical protein
MIKWNAPKAKGVQLLAGTGFGSLVQPPPVVRSGQPGVAIRSYPLPCANAG